MKKSFEYKIVGGMNKQKWFHSFLSEEDLLNQLNKYGADGREIDKIIHSNGYINKIILKREI